ncbi:MAG: hypothetical protein KatS3mg051_1543 [Anaerolineae bacterium]|nr:MAG: hypothetical protein KatS3mg051_1543 [Anaerolineae bacterium]
MTAVRLGPARADLTLYRGDSPRLSIVLPVDLSGYTVRMHIRNSGGSLLVALNSANGDLIVLPNTGYINGVQSPVAGRSIVRLRALTGAEEAAIIAAGGAIYDLEVSQGSTVKTFLRGQFRLEEDVTL